MRKASAKNNIATEFLQLYFYTHTARSTGKVQKMFSYPSSRARALFVCVVQYTSLSYHPMYFIMYGSMCVKEVWEMSPWAAHVPKWPQKEMRSARLQFLETATKPTRTSKFKNF